ncbi:glycosyltransferase family 4 protein [Ohtaekwangia koreensis]|uniref:Glycosyltransferase involved in cell wall bisynthesis n=1 Tax=Ohtaekwangia koreensis TaxID=688867 RepID=A0A1T5LK02_9BACT|nr:glycosyltransferase family 4 protein [Ohtaekwangia koreensis]SKC75788.1 Glycosyltransferase involved in cell wall bisynthesis [Ohtaekwangia koreensis]
MKVLILHQHFNTPQKGGALRSYYLAKALTDQGIHTVVITGHNENVQRVETIEGIEVHYLPIPYQNQFGFYKRSVSFLKYIMQSVRVAGTIKDVDLCYAISVPLTIGLAALWIKKRFKIPYIFEVGDLWPDAPIQIGVIKNYFLKQSLYSLEKYIYEEANSVVALSPMIKAAIEKKSSGKKVHLITNMADTDFYYPESKDPALEAKYSVQGKFVVSYIGAIGYANGLDYFLECARNCQKASLPVHFLLCGDGGMANRLRESTARIQLSNLTFVPFTNRDGVKELMNITDASFICYRPLPILETGSPNKYFDGLAAGKLIVVNFGGWIKEEIEKYSCGFYSDPKHPTAFVQKIQVYIADKKLLKQSQQASRLLAEEKYSRTKLSNEFASILKSGR